MKQFIKPFRMDFSAKKIRFRENAAEQTCIGLDAGDGVLLESAAEAGDGFLATVAPGDEFTEERIVVHRNGPAFVDAFIEADTGAAGRVARKNCSGRREKIVVGIFCVEADFHGMAARRDGFPSERKTMAGGNRDLQLDKVEAGDLLGDGMLDLKARVDFQKIKIEMGVDEKFNGAGVDVAAGAREANGGITHLFAKLRSDDERRCLFDDFLMAALNRAFALSKRDDAAMGVGEDLNFDVARLFEIFFEV